MTLARGGSSFWVSTRRRRNLPRAFALAAKQPLVKGFAVGRTIFGNAARAWIAGDMSDG